MPKQSIGFSLEEIEERLGPFGFQWLCACAVYPGLRFPITQHLGIRLAEAVGRAPPDSDELRSFFQLPWFRQGWMPRNVRVKLARQIEPALVETVRNSIAEVLDFGADERLMLTNLQKHTDLAHLSRSDTWRHRPSLMLGRRRSWASDTDQVFVSFMLGYRLPAGDFPLGRSRMEWLPVRLVVWRDWGFMLRVFVGTLVLVSSGVISFSLLPIWLQSGVGEDVAGIREEVSDVRGNIVDRNGVLLAISLPAASLYADPTVVPDPDEAASRLADILDELDIERTARVLDSDRRFVWLLRHLTPSQQAAVIGLGIPGLGFMQEERRTYPLSNLTAHIVGFADIDGQGLAGIEAELDARLEDGAGPVALSIDTRLQAILREELAAAIDEYRAIGGAGLIMNTRTGELLALVSLPDFDPYQAGRTPDNARFNRATLGLYEMGSTFKIFTTAMALDSGTVRLTDAFDARHPIRIGRHSISDFHAEARWLTVPEVFRYSSNIGAVRMALAVGTEGQRDYLGRLGLLEPATIELPEVGRPQIPSPWREINTMTISFGHGVSVSPVNLATAVSAVVNGGIRHDPTLLRRQPGVPVPGTQVLAPSTSDVMRRLLRQVVEEGTGRRADAAGYLVGGKSGTAEKPAGVGDAQRRLLSSFIAAFPMTNPDYVVFAMLDEPQGTAETYGYATGGWVAAPVVRRVVERIGPIVGVSQIDPAAPEVREQLDVPDVPEPTPVGLPTTEVQ